MSVKDKIGWEFVSKLVVRKTGFPFELLEKLHWGKTSKVLCILQELEYELDQIAEHLLNKIIPQIVVKYVEKDQKEVLNLLSRIRKYLGKGVLRNRELDEVKDIFNIDDVLTVALLRWREIIESRKKVLEQAEEIFYQELKEKRQVLQDIFSNPYLAEAIYISNPDIYNISYSKFLSNKDFEKRPSKNRTLEMRFYSYLQRFCSKNDTASFFGPMNYARWEKDQKQALVIENQPGKYIDRVIHYSFWMVRELAQCIATEVDIRPFLFLKLHPMCNFKDGRVCFTHLNKEINAPKICQKILKVISKNRTLYEVAEHLNMELEVLNKYLEQLIDKKILIVEIEIPSTIFDPISYLYNWVKALPLEGGSKKKWIEILDQFIIYKEDVLAGDLAHRQRVTKKIECLFEEVTNQPSRRNQGQMYADRTLYYEECKGTLQNIAFGEPFYKDFMEKIKPVFDLSAAYGDVMRSYYQTIAKRLYDKIKEKREQVPYSEFIYRSQELLQSGVIDLTFRPLMEFNQKLHELVSKRQNGSLAILSKEDIEEFEHFRKYEECHTSPDIMFSAKDVDSLARGEYKIVLGEVHQFIAMWGSQLLFDSEREKVNQEIIDILKEMPMYQQLSVILNTRRHKGLIHESFPGTIIQLFGIPSNLATGVVEIRDLYVTLEEEELKLKDNQERVHYLYNSGDENIHLWAFAPSRVSSPMVRFTNHIPRIEINGVVFQRERWDLGEEDLKILKQKDDAFSIYIEMQRIRQAFKLPRFVFFKVDSEKKPYYFDFENFFAVEMLQSLLKKNQGVTFIEMEPSPEHLWLKDEEGRYCFEMRGTVFQTKGKS